MRVDNTDLTQLRGQVPILIEEAHGHLDAIYHYYTPGDEPRTDFSNAQEHTSMASRVGRLLEIAVETSQFTAWADAVEAAMNKHGADANLDHVIEIITPTLARRAVRLTTAGTKFGPIANLFWTLQCQSMGAIIETCGRLNTADANLASIIEEVAPTLGLTPDGCRAEIKAGNEDVRRALAEHAVAKTEDSYRARGLGIPAGLHAMALQAAGLTPPASIDGDAASIFERMGIDINDVKHDGRGNFEVELHPGSDVLASLMRGGMNGAGPRVEIG